MTNPLSPALRSSSLSYSVEHDSSTGERTEASIASCRCRYNGEDKEERISEKKGPSDISSRVPIATDPTVKVNKDSSVPNVVEPDQPSSLVSQAHRDGSLEGLKRHHCRSTSRRSGSQENLDEDDCSVGSSDTQSSRESSTSRKPKRQHAMKVHFAEELVSEVFTRPRTLTEDKRLLHYTFEEMDEFREEYNRLCEEEEEQMLLDELVNSSSSDDSSLLDGYPTDCSVLSESSSISDAHLIDDDVEENESSANKKNEGTPGSPSLSRKHSISKVLVVHNDLSVFCPDQVSNKSDVNISNNDSAKGARKKLPLVYMATNDKDDNSFDNPAFWNGSLTWY